VSAAVPQFVGVGARVRLDPVFYISHRWGGIKASRQHALRVAGPTGPGNNRYEERDLTVNGLDRRLPLAHAQLLGDLAFEAGAAEHALRPPAVEGRSVEVLQAGTHAAQRAELLTALGSLRFVRGTLGYLPDLTGQHLI